MIFPKDILKIIVEKSEELFVEEYCRWNDRTERVSKGIKLDKEYFDDVANKIYEMLVEEIQEIRIENATLNAKVYTYEKILENSNFKAVLRKEKNEATK